MTKDVFAALCCVNYNERLDMLKNIARSTCEQYFDPDIIKLGEDESFIDCGGFTGDTIQSFIKHSANRFKVVHSFEPSATNIKGLINNFSHDKRIIIHNFGVGNEKASVRFEEKGSCSNINERGQSVIQIEKLDDILNDESASFIKMDIEGFELDALYGAERTICKYRPKLAICVYHKDMDVFHIIRYLKKCVSEYKFYLRHYNYGLIETVLYAIIK